MRNFNCLVYLAVRMVELCLTRSLNTSLSLDFIINNEGRVCQHVLTDRGNKTKILAGGGNPGREDKLRLDKMWGEISTFAQQFILI